MVESQKTDKAEDVLKSVEEFAAQAKLIALNLASAAATARNTGNIPIRVNDDILDLVDQTTKASDDINKMIKMVKMEMGSLYRLSRQGVIEFEKNQELLDKIERSLEFILSESQRVLYLVKKLKSISIDNKLI
ncbi:MAG: methyl-accepting chemotaxis protein [candidate division Zixibacteria bacterium]|jgi:methyl-accepting chemotaxis protein PixJ|nr:methyl-accepting chemotaxis protein [candidate division Zixibacteria bacterium]